MGEGATNLLPAHPAGPARPAPAPARPARSAAATGSAAGNPAGREGYLPIEAERAEAMSPGEGDCNRTDQIIRTTKTITEVIKFLYLSSHNPGTPEITKDFKQLPTYKPRP